MTTDSSSDSELMARTRRGDDRAFAEIYCRYQSRVFAYLRRLVRNDDVAADLSQDAFFRLWRAAPDWKSSSSVIAYLLGIARNLAVDRHRRQEVYDRWREQSRAEPMAAPAAPDQVLTRQELEERVNAAIDELPPRAREVFILKRDAGLSYTEISALLGIAPKTVEAHMSLALRLLREKLADLRRPLTSGPG